MAATTYRAARRPDPRDRRRDLHRIVVPNAAGPARTGRVRASARPRRAAGPPTPRRRVRRSLVLILAGLSAGAAVIHLVAAPSHYAEIGDLAAGFVVSAAFQAAVDPVVPGRPVAPDRWRSGSSATSRSSRPGPGPARRPAGRRVRRRPGAGRLSRTPRRSVFELLLVAGLVARRSDLDVALARRAELPADRRRRGRAGPRPGARPDVARDASRSRPGSTTARRRPTHAEHVATQRSASGALEVARPHAAPSPARAATVRPGRGPSGTRSRTSSSISPADVGRRRHR